jgi:hypothetical protein
MDSDSKKPKFEFQLQPLASDKLLQPPRWIIKGIWPKGCMTLFKGLPGAYKSFNTLAMNLCAWSGLPFCGRPVKRCKPFYIGADDPDGVKLRAQAWVKYHENQLRELGIPLDFMDAMLLDRAVNFAKQDEVDRACEDIKRQFKPDAITIDTFFHSTVGADLSQPKEVLPIITRIKKFLADLEAHTSMLVHHTPKDGKGFWGSVIIEGTVDVMIHCEVNEKIADTATLTCERTKGDRKFAPIDITLKAQVIKTLPDEDAVDEVEQLVVVSGAPSPEKKTAADENLEMIEFFLQTFLGNKATHAQIVKQMQKYATGSDGKLKRGWSEDSIDRMLAKLKERGRIVGGGEQGEYYSVVQPGAGNGVGSGTGAGNSKGAENPSANHPPRNPQGGIAGDAGGFEGPATTRKAPANENAGGSRESGAAPDSSVAMTNLEKQVWENLKAAEPH